MQEGDLSDHELLKRLKAIYTKAYVADVAKKLAETRERFGPNRKTGARKLRGAASAAAGLLWSARDLRKRDEQRKGLRGFGEGHFPANATPVQRPFKPFNPVHLMLVAGRLG